MIEIIDRMNEHLRDSKAIFPESRIVGLYLQGSQNYGLETEASDVDTKLVVVPSFEDICFNRKPVSTTYIRSNNEHIDFKDIRLVLQTFRKQNLNFVETLFTQYKWLNPLYANEWQRLIDNREAIAHYNPYQAVKAMKGIALEKYHAMEHEYPSKIEIIRKYGYDCKQLCHLLRINEYLNRYIQGESYEACLQSRRQQYLKNVKQNLYCLEEARVRANITLDHVCKTADTFCAKTPNKSNPEIDKLLDDVQCNIMRCAIKMELEEK